MFFFESVRGEKYVFCLLTPDFSKDKIYCYSQCKIKICLNRNKHIYDLIISLSREIHKSLLFESFSNDLCDCGIGINCVAFRLSGLAQLSVGDSVIREKALVKIPSIAVYTIASNYSQEKRSRTGWLKPGKTWSDSRKSAQSGI